MNEITDLIKKEVSDYQNLIDEKEIGTVLDIGDGIAQVYGLDQAMANEMLEFQNGTIGLAFNLEENCVGVIILGDYLSIKEGDIVKRTGNLLSIPVGEELIGRIVNPLGQPIDGLGPIHAKNTRLIESQAPGISERQPVKIPLQTGIKAIDSMIPIGRGQRELIIGDRQTGKTTIAIDTIINQKNSGVICVYVAIGQKISTISNVVDRLKKNDAMKHTIVVATGASDPASMLYIAPYSGCAMAEYFMFNKNQDTLCIYDDLSKQANAYRQISLLLQRPPGREAFPGDVFYIHSKLLERSAKLSDSKGGGSLTALPIIETQEGEVSDYIPTNVISITDGQIYLSSKLFASGVRPAIDVGISVSRVGGSAQLKGMKKVAGTLRLEMAQFRSLESFAQIGTDLDPTTQKQLQRGYRLVEILKQDQYQPVPVEQQIIIIYTAVNGFLDEIHLSQIENFKNNFLNHMITQNKKILDNILKEKKISHENELNEKIKHFLEKYKTDNNL